jgi:DNA-binding NarL/FixJ family response regulator
MRKSKSSKSFKDIEKEVKEARTIIGRKRLRNEIDLGSIERDVEIRENISSNGAYWDDAIEFQLLGSEGEIKEHPRANPDYLTLPKGQAHLWEQNSTPYPKAFKSNKVKKILINSNIKLKLKLLSDREREVLEMVCNGYSLEETARLLDINKSSISMYINRARIKLK